MFRPAISGFGETKCRKKGKESYCGPQRKSLLLRKWLLLLSKRRKKAAAAKKTAAAAKKKRKNGKRGRGKKQRFIFC